MDVEGDVKHLLGLFTSFFRMKLIFMCAEFLKRLGTPDNTGKIACKFGVLFRWVQTIDVCMSSIDLYLRDDQCQQQLESLVGTLKTAKKRGLIAWEGQMLLSPVNDDVVITLLTEWKPFLQNLNIQWQNLVKHQVPKFIECESTSQRGDDLQSQLKLCRAVGKC